MKFLAFIFAFLLFSFPAIADEQINRIPVSYPCVHSHFCPFEDFILPRRLYQYENYSFELNSKLLSDVRSWHLKTKKDFAPPFGKELTISYGFCVNRYTSRFFFYYQNLDKDPSGYYADYYAVDWYRSKIYWYFSRLNLSRPLLSFEVIFDLMMDFNMQEFYYYPYTDFYSPLIVTHSTSFPFGLSSFLIYDKRLFNSHLECGQPCGLNCLVNSLNSIFPFDIFVLPSDLSLICPALIFFGYEWDLCWAYEILRLLKYPILVSLAVKIWLVL